MKVILFLIHELFREQNPPKKSHFFNLQDSSLGRYVSAASRKSLEIQATLSQNEEPFWSENFLPISFQLL